MLGMYPAWVAALSVVMHGTLVGSLLFKRAFGGAQIPLAGGEICGYLGLMKSSTILYPEQIMLDAEIALNVYETYKAFEFKDLDANLDVIKEVGPQGTFPAPETYPRPTCVIFIIHPSSINLIKMAI